MVAVADSTNAKYAYSRMKQGAEVSTTGIFSAIGLSLMATIGEEFTTGRGCCRYNAVWLGLFAVSVLMLAAAAVNFDPKRWLA
ncbi:MAG TPA: hypothetical protein VG944_09995 [Fimbriimonas sp.]|nr:hypothetical protein [Fimbriimonas sp.]